MLKFSRKNNFFLFKETGGGGVPGTLTELYEAAKGLKGVQTLIKIILTYPVTSAKAERSFSSHRRQDTLFPNIN